MPARRIPKALLVARGSRHANSPIHRNEVEYAPGVPQMPEFLSPIAQEKWNELVPLLVEARILTPLDRGALAVVCEAWRAFVEATVALEKKGGRRDMYARADKRNAAKLLTKAL